MPIPPAVESVPTPNPHALVWWTREEKGTSGNAPKPGIYCRPTLRVGEISQQNRRFAEAAYNRATEKQVTGGARQKERLTYGKDENLIGG